MAVTMGWWMGGWMVPQMAFCWPHPVHAGTKLPPQQTPTCWGLREVNCSPGTVGGGTLRLPLTLHWVGDRCPPSIWRHSDSEPLFRGIKETDILLWASPHGCPCPDKPDTLLPITVPWLGHQTPHRLTDIISTVFRAREELGLVLLPLTTTCGKGSSPLAKHSTCRILPFCICPFP